MDLKNRLENVKDRINQAALKCGRDPESIQLVAVSKTIPANRVKEAIEIGVAILGENYVQEARNKFNILGPYNVSWHFIGHLQTNKAKYAVRVFDLIHSVDTLKLARELNKQAKKIINFRIFLYRSISEKNRQNQDLASKKQQVLSAILYVLKIYP